MADQTELTIEQLAELSNAALVNARALLDDAQALLDGGRMRNLAPGTTSAIPRSEKEKH